MTGRRELGAVAGGIAPPPRTPEAQALADRALDVLRGELDRMAAMREAGEAPPSPRLDAASAQLEGASRFAIRMGLISPGEARTIWQEAAAAGLQRGRPARDDVTNPEGEQ